MRIIAFCVGLLLVAGLPAGAKCVFVSSSGVTTAGCPPSARGSAIDGAAATHECRLAAPSSTTEPERRTDDRASLVNVIFTTRGYVGIGVGTLRAEARRKNCESTRAGSTRT